MKLFTIMILVCSLALAGCATASGPERALVLSKCPVLKTYSTEELQRAAKELRNLPSESEIANMLTDYSKLRDACRVVDRKLKTRNKISKK